MSLINQTSGKGPEPIKEGSIIAITLASDFLF